MKRKSVAAGAILAAGLSLGQLAGAQAFLADRAANQGRGIRVGNFELHPGVAAEFGYDSNVFYTPPSGSAVQALRLRLTPSFAISTLTDQRLQGGNSTANNNNSDTPQLPPAVNFSAHVDATYHLFIPVVGTFSGTNPSNLGVNGGFTVSLFPQRTWQFLINDEFSRIVQGSVGTVATGPGAAPDFGVSLSNFNRLQNQGQLELGYAPNSGTLDFRLGVISRLTFFEQQSFGYLSNTSIEVYLRNRWRFLPKTALMFDASTTPTLYINPNTLTTGPSITNTFPVRARIGINGLLTERLSLLLMVGYQGIYANQGDNLSTIIAQAELRYIFSELTAFRLGLIRDGNTSFVGNYYIRNQLYLGINQTIARRFYINAEALAGVYQFGAVIDQSNTACQGSGLDASCRFIAFRVGANAFAEYRFTDWFGLNLSLQYTGQFTGASLGVSVPQQLGWNKFEGYIGARVSW